MSASDFTLIALGLLVFALISGRIQMSVLTPPILFTLFGYVIGVGGLRLISVDVEHGAIHTLAEMTLMLVLFADATRIDLTILRREQNLPLRMLAIGMPLTILLGTFIAMLIWPELTLWPAAVLATMLAPTDAALGQAVISNHAVPMRIRQTLNVESGLNDGIAVPVLIVLLTIAGASHDMRSSGELIRFGAMQVILGPLAGVAVGYGGGWLLERAIRHHWVAHSAQKISAIGLALLAFGAATLIDGNGFIAAFVAGMVLGNFFPAVCTSLYEFVETEGELLTLFVFLIFGAILVPEALHELNWQTVLYALLSLTVIRMLPVALSLLGTGLRPGSFIFLGWFGPRGLATILFGLLVLEDSTLLARNEVAQFAMIAVMFSIFAHGVTAFPLSQLYGRYVESMQVEMAQVGMEMSEMDEVTEMPMRPTMLTGAE